MFDRLKDTLKEFFKSRLSVLLAVFCLLFLIVAIRLFNLQIVKGEEYQDNYTLKITKTVEVPAARGNIYDRNGNVLATNRLAYAVLIEDNGSYEDNDQKNEVLNDTINRVIDIVKSHGDKVTVDFGIKLENEDYAFVHSEGQRRERFLADVYGHASADDLTDEEKNSSPDDVMDFLCKSKRKTKEGTSYGFGIDKSAYGKERALEIVSVRYAIFLNSFRKYIPVTVSSDVSDETVAEISENAVDLQGVSIGRENLREYPYSIYFSPVLGYTGKISQEEYDALGDDDKDKYSLNDVVGKTGIEQLLEPVLRGEKGEETVYVNNVGKVIKRTPIKEAKAGNDVYLTLDKDLQITAYKLIEEKLAGIILRKLTDSMDVTKDPNADTESIMIPVGDIYCAFMSGGVIDTERLSESDATDTEKSVYAAFSKRLNEDIAAVMSDLKSSSSPAYSKLSRPMQAYMNYICSDLLTSKAGIIVSDRVDTKDEVYDNWKDEKINLYSYINHAIQKGWVDTAKLHAYMEGDDKYASSRQIYAAVLKYLENALLTDTGFENLVYYYMIKDGSLSPAKVCLLLYEQGILDKDNDDWYDRLRSGYNPYDFVREKLASLEITPGQLGVEPSTGSYVMTEAPTGRTLVCVSYPGYDGNRLANSMDVSYYNQIYNNKSKPLLNKATQELTAPGSTFKMVSASAGLEEGVITASTVIRCTGTYTNVTPNPRCWIYPSAHGNMNVVSAIAHSCNSFFYDVGYRLGIKENGAYSSARGTEKLAKYAKMYGLGDKSGLEISEMSPNISDEDSVRSAIGQGKHVYTVSQMAKYVQGVANKGTVNDLTLLLKETSPAGKTVKEYKPHVYKRITEIGADTFEVIHEGMTEVVRNDARFRPLFQNGITVAAKTGTAQQSKTHPDHVLSVGFAPRQAPQVAFACRIANGYSSGYPLEIGCDMLLKYFNLVKDENIITGSAAALGTEVHQD